MGSLRTVEYDWAGAERELRRAVELDPRSTEVRIMYAGTCLAPQGRLDEAVAMTQAALELDPLSPYVHERLGTWFFYMRQFDRAIEQFHLALELDPHYVIAHLSLCAADCAIGRVDEAGRILDAVEQLIGVSPISLPLRGVVHALAGRVGEAQKVFADLQAFARTMYVPSMFFAWICMTLGDIERALDYCEQAVAESDWWVLSLPVNPGHDPLRARPRYAALLRKMNLES